MSKKTSLMEIARQSQGNRRHPVNKETAALAVACINGEITITGFANAMRIKHRSAAPNALGSLLIAAVENGLVSVEVVK